MKRGFVAAVVTLLIGVGAWPAEACTCSWTGPLLVVAPGADSVVRARVIGYYGRSRGVDLAMDVEVLEVLKGVEHRGRMRIWGDNGAQCRPYVSAFPRGTQWIFAVSRVRQGQGSGDFAISVCGEYWARVEGDEVRGRLSAATPPSVDDIPERLGLAELRARLRGR